MKLVVEKRGLSEAQAKQAVETATVCTARGHLKDSLTEFFAGQVEAVLRGAGDLDIGGLAQGLGGLPRRKQGGGNALSSRLASMWPRAPRCCLEPSVATCIL